MTSASVNPRSARLDRLHTLVHMRRTLRLDDAAQALAVSTMTLRRDLADGKTGLRLLGGYVIDSRTHPTAGYILQAEKDSHLAAKIKAGRHAAALVKPGDTVFVDCGTTTPHLIAALPADLKVTIVCYALNIANAAGRMTDSQLYLIGGFFQPSSATFYARGALRSLKSLGINKAFLSAGGLHHTHGVSCSNLNEVPVKKAVLRHSLQSFLLIDATKIGQIKPARFASVEDVDRIVMETGQAG